MLFDRALPHWLRAGFRIRFSPQNISKREENRGLKSACPLEFASCCPQDSGHQRQVKKAGQTLRVETCDRDTSVVAGNSTPRARHASEASPDHHASASQLADHRCRSPADVHRTDPHRNSPTGSQNCELHFNVFYINTCWGGLLCNKTNW